jgi:hypothetical protein
VSFFASYVVGEGEPVDGDDIASTTGWNNWSEWVLSRHEDYPEAAHLAQEGWLDEGQPGSLDALEHELERLLHEMGDADLAAISAQLLAALRAKPTGTSGLLITDGEPGDEDDEEDEADE